MKSENLQKKFSKNLIFTLSDSSWVMICSGLPENCADFLGWTVVVLALATSDGDLATKLAVGDHRFNFSKKSISGHKSDKTSWLLEHKLPHLWLIDLILWHLVTVYKLNQWRI